MSRKIGRNEVCPCGSGKKYKRCHANLSMQKLPPGALEALSTKMAAIRKQKEHFGEVRPIVSTEFKGYRLVAVGSELQASKRWKTFHDFLLNYIKTCLSPSWGDEELRKPLEDRHPVLHWYGATCDFQSQQSQTIKPSGQIWSAVATGPVAAYLALAYDLYLLRHHSLLQERLVERLKIMKQFQGARYEIYVAASFIKAGFEIDFERETDRSTTHCEFVATHKLSKTKYSVEAKSRHREGVLGREGKRKSAIKARIGSVLRQALIKQATYERIVFIDVNMPPELGFITDKKWFPAVMDEVGRLEKEGLANKSVPPAYLFFTNHPNHYVDINEIDPSKDFLMTAINRPEFKKDFKGSPGSGADRNLIHLWNSINQHIHVPHTFELGA